MDSRVALELRASGVHQARDGRRAVERKRRGLMLTAGFLVLALILGLLVTALERRRVARLDTRRRPAPSVADVVTGRGEIREPAERTEADQGRR